MSAETKFSGEDAKRWWWENIKETPFKMKPEKIWAHMERYAQEMESLNRRRRFEENTGQ